ncbi:MAG: hypothetical protein K0V04_46635 [Deltaproteobacteria bacterium]|nr:hypothetical protein [Deltaproteobacteria bacterium]
MKYTTFRSLIIVAGLGLTGLGFWQCSRCAAHRDADDQRSATQPSPRSVAAVPEPPVAPPPAGASDPLAAGTPVDVAMASARARPVQSKIKDASKGMAFKINIYSDDGSRWNRAKIDLDRDDHWDEKWTFGSDGSIEKKVAPNDDDSYSLKFAFGTDGWRPLP